MKRKKQLKATNWNSIILVIGLVLSIPQLGKTQLTLGIAIGGIGYHPKADNNSEFYAWKLSKSGKLTGFAGVTFSIAYRMNDYIGVKAIQTVIVHDSAGKHAGLSHLGINLYDDIIGLRSKDFEASLSFGPMWYYRKGWVNIPQYAHDSTFMNLSDDQLWESKFVWHAGQIQLKANLTNNFDLTTNLFPGHPYLYAMAIGLEQTLH